MRTEKVLRYYSDCGRGFWSKQKALIHDTNCKCWKNEKFKTCISCKHKDFVTDSDGSGASWVENLCDTQNGIPAHENAQHVIMNCHSWASKMRSAEITPHTKNTEKPDDQEDNNHNVQ